MHVENAKIHKSEARRQRLQPPAVTHASLPAPILAPPPANPIRTAIISGNDVQGNPIVFGGYRTD
jgi:hypothetical protein